jgi:hypothetical protein
MYTANSRGGRSAGFAFGDGATPARTDSGLQGWGPRLALFAFLLLLGVLFVLPSVSGSYGATTVRRRARPRRAARATCPAGPPRRR